MSLTLNWKFQKGKWVGISFYLERIHMWDGWRIAAANSLEKHMSTFLLVKIYVHNFLLAKYSHLSGLEAIYYRYVNPLPNPLRHVWLLLPRSWSSWLFWRAFICRWNLCWSEHSCSRYWQVLLLSVWNRCLIPSDVFWRQIFFFFRVTS